MFWQKKRLNSDEFEDLTKRIIVLEADLSRVRNILDSTGSNLSSLRGIVNRKLGGKVDPVDEEQPRGIDDGFNELRKLNKDKSS